MDTDIVGGGGSGGNSMLQNDVVETSNTSVGVATFVAGGASDDVVEIGGVRLGGGTVGGAGGAGGAGGRNIEDGIVAPVVVCHLLARCQHHSQ